MTDGDTTLRVRPVRLWQSGKHEVSQESLRVGIAIRTKAFVAQVMEVSISIRNRCPLGQGIFQLNAPWPSGERESLLIRWHNKP